MLVPGIRIARPRMIRGTRRDAGAVERARLESGCTVYSRTEGSNPSLSARYERNPLLRVFSYLVQVF